MKKIKDEYLRSSLFGLEDALVSTTGMVVGISIGSNNRDFILLAAFVTIAVEAVSMAAGEFLSDKAVHELDHNQQKDNTLISATAMLFSYIVGGLIPVIPIIFLQGYQGYQAIIMTIAAAFTGLFVLGYVKGRVVKVNMLRSATEMLVIGGIATAIGVTVGLFLKI